jgi:Flp pilus assembly CpaF family ATPase
MVQMGNMGLPARSILTQIIGAVDLIVQIERQRDGVRRVVRSPMSAAWKAMSPPSTTSSTSG